jgi:glucose-1-phosphate thymidylyltransferase
MNVIIPVAGEGVRLKPHTNILPKSLIHVAGKPILGHILDGLKSLKVEKLVIVLGAKGDQIASFCRQYRYDFRLVKQPRRLGLGHAVYLGSRGLKGETMVLLGDTIIDTDYRKFCAGSENTLAVKAVEDPRRFGIVEVRGREVIDVVEKPEHPKSNLAITGLYYFRDIRKVHNAIAAVIRQGVRTRGEYQLTDGLRQLIRRGEKFRIKMIEKWFDCGTADALIDTNQHLLIKTNYYRRRPSVVVYPPVYIPDSAVITGAIIGPNVSIGERAVVKNSIIRNSIVNREAIVENDLLDRSIIGEKAVVRGKFKKLNVGDSSMIELP